ncbi:DNA-directed RNA polymerase subunit delta [Alkalicoccobacillus murimartini]|uniref:Probable DNA-directed RNA polymerase subunit delta n=1 Tax=Alkalicoccobacillus murimartini TaxID=171685 RepID=A0ABT9YHI6_9BACI|nr:DNA-directed RNA polymerase subunit delta [Alkalicoccobacillus murimartini]
MKFNNYTADEIQEMSMIEIAFELMQNKNQPIEYYALVDEIAKIKGMSKQDVKNSISFLYTDLNTDGRFITMGENRWGIKAWYPIDQIEEPVPAATPKKKKKKASQDDDDLDLVDDSELDDSEEDEFEDLADELDEISNEEDASEEDFEEKDLDGFDDDDDEEDDDEDEAFDSEDEEDR